VGEAMGKNLDVIVPVLHRFSIVIAALIVLAVIYAVYRLILARRKVPAA